MNSFDEGIRGLPFTRGGSEEEYKRGLTIKKNADLLTGVNDAIRPNGNGLGKLFLWIFCFPFWATALFAGIIIFFISLTGFITKIRFEYAIKTGLYSSILIIPIYTITIILALHFTDLVDYSYYILLLQDGEFSVFAFVLTNFKVLTLLLIPSALISALIIQSRKSHQLTGLVGFFKSLILVLLAIIPGILCSAILFNRIY